MSSAKGYYDNITELFGSPQPGKCFVHRGLWLPYYSLKEEYADEMLSIIFPTEERRTFFQRKDEFRQMEELRLCVNNTRDFVVFDKDQLTVATMEDMESVYDDAAHLHGFYWKWVSGGLFYDGILIGLELSLKYTPFKPVSKESFLLWVGSSVMVPYEEITENGESRYHEDLLTLVYNPRKLTSENLLERLNAGDAKAKALFEKLYPAETAFEIPVIQEKKQ